MPAAVPEGETAPEPAPTLAENNAAGEASDVAETDGVDAGQGDSQAIAAVTVDETDNGLDEGAADAVAGTQDAAATPTADLSIEVSVENSTARRSPSISSSPSPRRVRWC